MIYTASKPINLHKCSIYKLDALTYLDEDLIVDVGICTNSMITTSRPQDFPTAYSVPKALNILVEVKKNLINPVQSF